MLCGWLLQVVESFGSSERFPEVSLSFARIVVHSAILVLEIWVIMIIPAVVIVVWVHAYCAWLNWVHIGYWSKVCLRDYIVRKNDCLGANGKVFECRVQFRWIGVVVHCKKKWSHKDIECEV